jgi:pimeloyl-ACP methyl ester carboxylesterase
MITIDSVNPFNADWNAINMRLNPNRGDGLERTIRKVVKCLLYIPNCIAATCFNPRSETEFYLCHDVRQNHQNFKKKIITPDQVSSTATVYIADNATSATATILLFNPLGANASVHNELTESLLAKKCHVITFDYRGLGTTRSADDLVLDGESVYQYATNELGVDKDKVHFYGFSLGGAIAAQVKALHPESQGKYVGDRAFKSVFSLITENCCIRGLGSVVKKITSLISASLIAFPIYLLGWEWDGSRVVSELSGDKRVIYHPNDWLVPFEASLARESSSEHRIQLHPSNTGLMTHFSTLDRHYTADVKEAVSVVANFLSG